MFLGITVFSCKNDSGLSNRQLKKFYISMETTACFGRCPIMTMEIDGNGKALLHGRRFMDSLGLFQRQLEDEQLYSIVKQANKFRWEGFEEEYLTGYTDLPSRIISYSPKPGDTFRVRFEEGAAPEGLERLGNMIYHESDLIKNSWRRIDQNY